MDELKLYARAILSHWLTLMGGGALIIGVGIFERAASRNISWPTYIALMCVLIVIASFLAWRDKQRELIVSHQEIEGLKQTLVKEQDPVRREFDAIRLRIMTTTLATEITQELGNLKALILSRRELLGRKDVGDFFIKWIQPYEIHLQYGAELGLNKTQYDEMREDLASIGDNSSKEAQPE